MNIKCHMALNLFVPSGLSKHTTLLLTKLINLDFFNAHNDVIKWKYFPRYWPFERGIHRSPLDSPFVRGIHRSPLDSPHKGQWRGALMFSLICAWRNSWVNNQDTGDLGRHRPHYDVTGMVRQFPSTYKPTVELLIYNTCKRYTNILCYACISEMLFESCWQRLA